MSERACESPRQIIDLAMPNMPNHPTTTTTNTKNTNEDPALDQFTDVIVELQKKTREKCMHIDIFNHFFVDFLIF